LFGGQLPTTGCNGLLNAVSKWDRADACVHVASVSVRSEMCDRVIMCAPEMIMSGWGDRGVVRDVGGAATECVRGCACVVCGAEVGGKEAGGRALGGISVLCKRRLWRVRGSHLTFEQKREPTKHHSVHTPLDSGNERTSKRGPKRRGAGRRGVYILNPALGPSRVPLI
jgi:hypothetical protein